MSVFKIKTLPLDKCGERTYQELKLTRTYLQWQCLPNRHGETVDTLKHTSGKSNIAIFYNDELVATGFHELVEWIDKEGLRLL